MRFKIEKSVHPGKWVCTDTENGIVCVFEHGEFNDTQQFTLLEDMKHDANLPNIIAKAVREMADWLRDNHYNKVF